MIHNQTRTLIDPVSQNGFGSLARPLRTIVPFLGICALVLACMVGPVAAGTKYTGGSPEISAAIVGTNEFYPDDDATISVKLQNTGLNDYKFVQSGIMDRDDLPNTAKFLVIVLDANGAPLVVKSDPQMVGDLDGGSSLTTSFNTKINHNAPAGIYNLSLKLNYTYLWSADQQGLDSIEYTYKTTEETIVLPVTIKQELRIDVLSTDVDQLNVGTEGILTAVVRNTGTDNGKKAVIKIAQNGDSPVVPTESSVFIGNFPMNGTVNAKFKVSASSNAEGKTYPLDIYVTYENHDGDTVDSDKVTIGVPVGNKITFNITSSAAEISPGEKKVLSFDFKNTGDTTAYDALARISAVDPFTSNDDTAYLGDMAPGETRTAKFEVSVDSGATKKSYGLDAEVRYRDAQQNSVVSDTFKAPVDIVARNGGNGISSTTLAIIAVVIVIAIAGIGFFLYRRNKQKKLE
ncbi:MAG: S-layer protein [Methanoregulaceae archaeon]